jgi:8-oxo-dGTP pyrophosphatase MutT (NUDIX family)
MRSGTQKGCSNCNGPHSFRQCLAPITSHGVIAFRVKNGWNPSRTLAENESAITGLEQSGPIEFLLIQRRDSLGFVEMMRGKYSVTDYNYILTQLKGMTVVERERVLTLPFTQLWNELWGVDHSHSQYRQEKETSRVKLEQLREQGLVNGEGVKQSLREVFATLGPGWDTPEWGFPKGRRDPYESERACALREMWEETGLEEKNVKVVENLEPIQESFFGSNHIHYCHKYRIVYVQESIVVSFENANEHMRREIGNLGWFTLEDALQKIRPENIEKKEVLLRAAMLLRNFCPLVLGAGIV